MAEYYNTITSDYLKALKTPALEYRFKIELLDHNERGLGQIVKDLSSIDKGQITINKNQGTRRSCSFTIIDVDKKYLPSIDNHFWYNRKFKLYIGLVVNEDIYWFSQGVFITKDASATHYNLSINAVDKFGFLDGTLNVHMLQSTYTAEILVSIGELIRSTIMLEMGNGQPIDPIEPIIDPEFENQKLINEITLDIGQYPGELLVQIATSLGADIFYDVNGRLHVTRVFNDDLPSWYIHKGEIWDFSDNNYDCINCSMNYEFDGVNYVTVAIDTGNDESAQNATYTAINDNPRSPISVSAVGYRCNSDEPIIYIPLGDDASQDTPVEKCRQHAEYVLLQKTCMSTPISLSCHIIPHLDVDECITITDEYYDWKQTPFLIQSISMPLSAGDMELSVVNLQWLPTDTESSSITLESYCGSIPRYTISYNIGEGEGVTPESITGIPGTTIALADGANITHPDLWFAGWTDEAGTFFGEFYIDHYAYTILNRNVEMTATFKDFVGDGILMLGIEVNESNLSNTFPKVFANTPQKIWWGDGTFDRFNSATVKHTYANSGEYTIKVQELEGDPCSFLESNVCEYIDTYNVKSIEFPDTITTLNETYNNLDLVKVKLPTGFYTLSDNLFDNCDKLEEFTFMTEENTFGGLNGSFASGVELYVPENVTLRGNVLNNSNITKLNCDGGYTSIDESSQLACSCENLTEVNISGDIDATAGKMFCDCPSLISINLTNEGNSYLRKGTIIADNCPSLENFILSDSTSIPVVPEGFLSNLPKLKNVKIKNIGGSQRIISPKFLYNNKPNNAMESLDISTLPVNKIEESGICNLTKLSTLKLPTLLRNGVNICNTLTSLNEIVFPTEDCTLSGFNASFSSDSLVEIPENITLTNTVFNSSGMSELTFRGTLNVECSFLNGCVNLATARIVGSGYINSSSFNSCINLENLYIGSEISINNSNSFMSTCPKLSNLTIEKGLTTQLSSGALYYSNQLNNTMTQLDLYKTSIDTIQSGCIGGLTALEYLRLPRDLKVLNEGVCVNLPKLTSVYIGHKIEEINTYGCLQGCPSNLTVFGYAETVAETFAAQRGLNFVDITIRAVDNSYNNCVISAEEEILCNNIESAKNSFNNCNNDAELTLTKLKTSTDSFNYYISNNNLYLNTQIESIQNSFNSNTAIKKVEINNENCVLSESFNNCQYLMYINLMNSPTIEQLNSCFNNCENLLIVKGKQDSTVQGWVHNTQYDFYPIDNYFEISVEVPIDNFQFELYRITKNESGDRHKIDWGDETTTSDYLEDGKTHTYEKAGNYTIKIKFDTDQQTFTEYSLSINTPGVIVSVKFPYGYKVINERTLKGCANLKYVYIPETVDMIHHLAFADCKSIMKIDISPYNTYCYIMDQKLYAPFYIYSDVDWELSTQIPSYTGYGNNKAPKYMGSTSSFSHIDNSLVKTITIIYNETRPSSKQLYEVFEYNDVPYDQGGYNCIEAGKGVYLDEGSWYDIKNENTTYLRFNIRNGTGGSASSDLTLPDLGSYLCFKPEEPYSICTIKNTD